MSELQNSLLKVSVQLTCSNVWTAKQSTHGKCSKQENWSLEQHHICTYTYNPQEVKANNQCYICRIPLTPPLFHEVLQSENSNTVCFAQICVPWKWYRRKFLLLFVGNRIPAALPWVWGDFCTKLQPMQCAKLQKIHNLAILCWFQGVDKQVSHFINGSNNHVITVCKGHVHHASHEPFQQRPLCIAATQDAHVAPRLGCMFRWKIVMKNSVKLISHNVTAKMAKKSGIIIITHTLLCAVFPNWSKFLHAHIHTMAKHTHSQQDSWKRCDFKDI